jgi:dissimilatory sulfite reductase (desulfoviridin) alpha/beta subunit
MTHENKSRFLTAEELKSGGFIPQRQKDLVAVRCRAPGGRLTAVKLRTLAEVAEKYGDGTVHLSVRMSPEILYINMKDLTSVIEDLGSPKEIISDLFRTQSLPLKPL